MDEMDMRLVPPNPVRRLVLGFVGAAMGTFVVIIGPYAISVAIGVAGDRGACLDGYSCPAPFVRVLAGVGVGLLGTAAACLFAMAGYGLVRYSVTGAWRRWIPLAALAAPLLAVTWFLSILMYGGALGAFS
jgi:hypothetical protein